MTDAVRTKAASPARAKESDSSRIEHAPTTRPAKASAATGGPLLLSLDLIDEDPEQPRAADNPGFSRVSIAELASTIELRGVKSPVSVRQNPAAPGRYIINHGARRYRASKVAGKAEIPAFIDDDYSQVDQVIENLQRNELTPREIANWIGREMAAGKKKGDIAKSLGKSAAFVSQHVTLLDLPDPIARVFHSARVNDVTVVNELVTAFRKNPIEVANWLEDESQELTRGSVKLFREFLNQGLQSATEEATEADEESADEPESASGRDVPDRSAHDSAKSDPDRGKLRKAVVRVTHESRAARLILTRRPAEEGCAWLKYDDDGQELSARLADVRLVALLEG